MGQWDVHLHQFEVSFAHILVVDFHLDAFGRCLCLGEGHQLWSVLFQGVDDRAVFKTYLARDEECVVLTLVIGD